MIPTHTWPNIRRPDPLSPSRGLQVQAGHSTAQTGEGTEIGPSSAT